METKYKRGKNPNSWKKRSYQINDNFFDNLNMLNCYYAGWIAADGCISDTNYLNIGISLKDKILFDNFLRDTNSNYRIGKYLAKNKFETVSLSIKSDNICSKLKKNFNILPRKSLLLKPPLLSINELIDSYIIGYIDGDGSISLLPGKRNKKLSIQIIGTYELLKWIEIRFSTILNENLNIIYKGKNHKNNTFSLHLSDKRARKIFIKYYNIQVPKLSRKWGEEKYNFCINFKKYENIEKYFNILKMEQSGFSKKEIGNNLGITYSAVSWYMKRDTYKKLKEKYIL